MLLLITAAGAGTRFQRQGLSTPKPLIQVQGLTLLEHTLRSFKLKKGDKVIIATQRSHQIPEKLDQKLCTMLQHISLQWVQIDRVLPGQLATSVHALEQIPTDDQPLLIHNCDTGFLWQNSLRPNASCYGSMAVFSAEGEHWSFGQPHPSDPGRAIAIAEKRRISNLASIGLYGFASSNQFLVDAHQQLDRGHDHSTTANSEMVNGEYYIAPLLNTALLKGEIVLLPRVENVKPYGTPAELCRTFAISWNDLLAANQLGS